MGYSYKSYSDTKEVFKKFVNAAEGQAVYGISRSHIMEMAKKAGAVYKVGNTALINTEIFEAYLEQFYHLHHGSFGCLHHKLRQHQILIPLTYILVR